MNAFFEQTMCDGKAPLCHAGRKDHLRPHVAGKLLAKRKAIRLVVAPCGYGKTGAVAEYANAIFEYRNTYWIDAANPCFLRELDRGAVASGLLAAKQIPALAVFEDLPSLDKDRSRSLMRQANELIENGCEVIMTCTPRNDTFFGRENIVRLRAEDLLATDDELDAYPSERNLCVPGELRESERVAGFVWSSDSHRTSPLLRFMGDDDVPMKEKALLYVAFVLQKGAVSDLRKYVSISPRDLASFARHNLHAGLDAGRETFEAARFSTEEIWRGSRAVLLGIARACKQATLEEFLYSLAETLMESGCCDRACDFIGRSGSKSLRKVWLRTYSPSLLSRACVLPATMVGVSTHSEATDAVTMMDEAVRRALLGDVYEARLLARHAWDASVHSHRLRVKSALLRDCLTRCDETPFVQRVFSTSAVAEPLGALAMLEYPAEEDGERGTLEEDCWLASMLMGCRSDVFLTMQDWMDETDEKPLTTRLMAALFLLSELLEVIDAESGLEGYSSAVEAEEKRSVAEKFFRKAAKSVALDSCQGMSLFGAGAVALIERASASEGFAPFVFDGATERKACEIADAIVRQRDEFKKMVELGDLPDSSRGACMAGTFGRDAEGEAIPRLGINLFGGFEITLDGEPIDLSGLSRGKSRLLLALLALSGGKEVSRTRLSSMMWPSGDSPSTAKNFYSVWSSLRKGLSFGRDQSPYLKQSRGSVSLNDSAVITDVAAFDELCRLLRFGDVHMVDWESAYEAIESRFSHELFPSEQGNAAIESFRIRFRARLVEAVVEASRRLLLEEMARESELFSELAIGFDEAREDAYVLLAKSYYVQGKRTKALAVCLKCKKALVEHLGIDPSEELEDLYRCIIDAEEGGSSDFGHQAQQ